METANLVTNAHLLMVTKTFNPIQIKAACLHKHRWEEANLISKISCRIFPNNLETWWILTQDLMDNRYLVNKTWLQLARHNSKAFRLNNSQRTWIWCSNSRCSRCSSNKTALVATMDQEISQVNRRRTLQAKEAANSTSSSSNNKCWTQWWCSSRCTCSKCRCHQCTNLFRMVFKSLCRSNNLSFLNKPTWRFITPSKHCKIMLMPDSSFWTSYKAITNFFTEFLKTMDTWLKFINQPKNEMAYRK